jgi:MYXO-CTERM domain-containing protein
MTTRRSAAVALSAVCLVASAMCLVAPVARAETNGSGPTFDPARPRGSYVEIDPSMAEIVQPHSHTSNVIYLNGCFKPGDCALSPGFESSIQNRSSIIDGSVTLSAFNAGPVAWDAVVRCVKQAYEPFGVEVTDEDPGNVPHFEAIVGGRPQEIGIGGGVGGVAPFSCGIINNAVTFSFANIYDGYVPQICWTVAQETAHAFGLDHEYLCADPMTYLGECGASKTFQDVDAQCGEFSPRQCQCGGAKQNSFRRIRDHFGTGKPTPPEVVITDPPDGKRVEPGYVVRANAMDNSPIQRVDLYINGQLIHSTNLPPYVFNAPTDISNGVHRIEVRAVDALDYVGTTRINVVQGAPCNSAGDCGDAETCVDGRCVAGPGTPGGLGETCASNEDCVSGLCGNSDSGSFCAEECEPENHGCPDGFGCRETSDIAVCWPGYEDGGCGCRVGARDGARAVPLLFALMLGASLVLRRRRR